MPLRKPTKIDFDSKEFTSCGVKYILHQDGMGYARASRFEQLVPEMLIGSTFPDHIGFLNTIYGKFRNANTDGDRADAIMLLFNVLKMGQDMLKGTRTTSNDIVLDFCALFFVTENEDLTIINEAHMVKKKDNWKQDMDLNDFFLFVALQFENSIMKFDPSYRLIREKLSKEKEIKKTPSKTPNTHSQNMESTTTAPISGQNLPTK